MSSIFTSEAKSSRKEIIIQVGWAETSITPNKRVSSAAPDIATHEEIYALLLERLPQVILDAWVNRKPGSFSNAFGRAPVGMCRRAMYSDNTAQMWGDTNTALFTALEGGNDSGIELIYFFDADQKLTGILANLACPAQCVQHRMFVSPDFWGEVKVLLRNHFGEDIFPQNMPNSTGITAPLSQAVRLAMPVASSWCAKHCRI